MTDYVLPLDTVPMEAQAGSLSCHAAGFLRWRPDKISRQCGFDQLVSPAGPEPVASWIASTRSG